MIWEIDERTQTIEGLDAQGRPDPAYAAALGLLDAPLGRRALAATIDAAIWVILLLPLIVGAMPLVLKLAAGSISAYGFLNHPDFLVAVITASASTLLVLAYLVVQLILHGVKGTTIGKAVTGIRSVNARTLERPRVGAVLLRFLIVGAAGVIPLLGPAFILVSPTFDPERRRRGLHDKATGVWLVDARRGLNPYDQKRMRVARKMVTALPAPGRAELPSLATPADPAAQPAYRPGSRVSAGVLGMARPHEPSGRPAVGLSLATPEPQPAPVRPGTPVLGGYRRSDPPAPAASAEPRAAEPSALAPADPPAPVARPVEPPAPPADPPAPQADPPTPEADPPAPAVPGSAVPTEQPAPIATFALRFDSGQDVPVSGPVLLGRNPDASEHPGAAAVALADDSRSLSKTHLLVRPVEGGLEIVDWRSTNGSGLIRGGTEYAVTAGTPVVTTDGDVIRLGDRVATVIRTSSDGTR